MSSSETAGLPRLIVVTNDEIIARAGFLEYATSIMAACAGAVAIQLRARQATAAVLHAHAAALAEAAAATGALLFLNERLDIALSVGAAGVQLSQRSVPVVAAASRRDLLIGYSAHAVDEAARASADGADFVVLGTIWSSTSHPGECPAGVERLSEAASRVTVPVYGIGGVTSPRAVEARLAGAHGVAVISDVWDRRDAADAAQAAVAILEAMQVVS